MLFLEPTQKPIANWTRNKYFHTPLHFLVRKQFFGNAANSLLFAGAALNDYLQTELDMKSEMIGAFPAVQAIKTVATERMLSAAHHYQQLAGGEGYRCGSPTNISAQAFLDARVYTIFDGTNDLLSQQLTEYCLARTDGLPLSKFLAEWPLTASAITSQGLDLGFLDRDLRQEHLVLAGRAIAYAFAIGQVMRWAGRPGADPAQARAAIEFLKADIAGVATEFGLLSSGVLGIEDGAVPAPAGVRFSRSVPVPAEA